MVQDYGIVCFPGKPCGSVGDFAVSGDGLGTVHLPVQSGEGEEALRQFVEGDSVDIVDNLNSVGGLNDVSAVVAEEDAADFDVLIAHFGSDLNVLVEVFFEDGVGVYEVVLEVLLEHLDALCFL